MILRVHLETKVVDADAEAEAGSMSLCCLVNIYRKKADGEVDK